MLEPELEKRLAELHALARDNHRMLRAIRRDHLIGMTLRVAVWVVVLGVPIYLYYAYLGPVIAKFETLSGVSLPHTGLFGLPSSADLQKLLNSFKAPS